MPTVIQMQGGRTVIYDDEGHIRMLEQGEDLEQVSVQTWPDVESATMALDAGPIDWGKGWKPIKL